MKFRKNNKIKYGQNHQFYIGIPSGVDFRVRRFLKDRFVLDAYGYGQLEPWDKNSYGNGKIYPYPNKKQIKRFERYLNETK